MEKLQENQKLLVKIWENEGNSENVFFKSFDFKEEFAIENTQNSPYDTFCIEGLRNKTQNCKVVFNGNQKFQISKNNQMEDNKENSLNYLISESESESEEYKNEKENLNKNYNSIKTENGIERIYFNKINKNSPNTEIQFTKDISFKFLQKKIITISLHTTHFTNHIMEKTQTLDQTAAALPELIFSPRQKSTLTNSLLTRKIPISKKGKLQVEL